MPADDRNCLGIAGRGDPCARRCAISAAPTGWAAWLWQTREPAVLGFSQFRHPMKEKTDKIAARGKAEYHCSSERQSNGADGA